MDLDLGDEVVFKVKVSGKVYELREPTTDEIEVLSESDNGDAKAATKMMKKFIVGLGMPSDVYASLGLIRTRRLIEGLTGSLTEKK